MSASKICLTCHESVDNASGIVCDSCKRTYHTECVEWTPQEHKNYKNHKGRIKWFCNLCNISRTQETDEKSLENIINMMDSSDILITHEFRKAFRPSREQHRPVVEEKKEKKTKSKTPSPSRASETRSNKTDNSGESLVLHISNKSKSKSLSPNLEKDSSESLVLHITNKKKGKQFVDSCEFVKRKPSLIQVSNKSFVSPKCLTKMEKVQEVNEEEESKILEKNPDGKKRSLEGFEQTKNNESLKTLFAQKQSLVKSFEHLDHRRHEIKKISSEALLVDDLVESISCMLKEEMKDNRNVPAEFYVNPNNSGGSLESDESDDRLEYIKDDIIEWNKNKESLKPIIKRRDSKEVKFIDDKSKIDVQVRSRGTNSSVLSHEKVFDKKGQKLSGIKISKSPKAHPSSENGFINSIVGKFSRIFPTKVKNQDKETEIDDEIKPFVADTSVQTNKKKFSNTGVNPTKTIRIDEECQHPEEATLDEEKDENDEDEEPDLDPEVKKKGILRKSKASSKRGELSLVRRPRSRSKSPKGTSKGLKSRKASQKGASPSKSKSFKIHPKRTEKTDG